MTSSTSDLRSRLDFVKFSRQDQENLQAVREAVQAALPTALDAFYDAARSTPETSRFFKDDAHMASAKNRQLGHWSGISEGRLDETFVANATRTGAVHARIGLEPRWYIGGYALILEKLFSQIIEGRLAKGGMFWSKAVSKALGAQIGALAKVALLDMDLVISVYLDATETARLASEAEQKKALAEQERVVATLAEKLGALAKGDLTAQISEVFPPGYEQLRIDFNHAVDRLEDAMGSISASTDAISTGTSEIAKASDDLSRRTEQQAASLEQTAAALDEITATVKRSAEGAKEAARSTTEARAAAAQSGAVVVEAVDAMGEIEQSSDKISQIIGVIDEIAFQTNLLALNAGVEAARAGDAGRGFAVVAQEVRALAQRSAEAAKEIKTLIANSTAQVARGVKLVGGAGQSLTEIVEKVAEIDRLITEMAQSSQEQATGLTQVNLAVNQMDQVTQQNAAMVEETTAAAASLRSETEGLSRQISTFKTGRGTGAFRPSRTQLVEDSPRVTRARAG